MIARATILFTAFRGAHGNLDQRYPIKKRANNENFSDQGYASCTNKFAFHQITRPSPR